MILETECEACKGKGGKNQKRKNPNHQKTFGDEFIKCYVCNGRGKILTIEGQELVDFVKYYLGDYFEIYRSSED